MPIIAIIITVLVAVSGTTAIVAESSIPGDILYPIKVNVNEGVRAGFTFTSQGRAAWDVRRAERRLEEVEALLNQGTLSPETTKAADEHFRLHIQAAKQAIASLHKSENTVASDTLNAKLEQTLKKHVAILSRVATQSANTNVALKQLLASVETESKLSAQLVSQAADTSVTRSSAGSGMRSAAEASMKSAENKIAEVRAFIDAKAAKSTTESVVEANTQLEVARSSYAAARAAWNNGAYNDAFDLVRTALHQAQEAKLILESSLSAKNDVRSSAPSIVRSVSGNKSSRGNLDVNLGTEVEAKINAAAKKIDEVRANVLARGTKLSAATIALATDRLDAAAVILAQARVKFGLNLDEDAKVMAETSFRMAVEVQAQLAKSGE